MFADPFVQRDRDPPIVVPRRIPASLDPLLIAAAERRGLLPAHELHCWGYLRTLARRAA